eukprot:CAMPEP_0116952154 /NCGR_PEP_ID=MMETSP0467-20121206/40557_1 /TAXON_ID=283647 /ORGANISM="Mesodinium pulex, Strain SPMC105" /LENGTH=130 /DNA_ID=CAMNT_0004637359 /DNA_START=107 /DNA_END=498 /DNA_ORIENTATION=-
MPMAKSPPKSDITTHENSIPKSIQNISLKNADLNLDFSFDSSEHKLQQHERNLQKKCVEINELKLKYSSLDAKESEVYAKINKISETDHKLVSQRKLILEKESHFQNVSDPNSVNSGVKSLTNQPLTQSK